jgi:hypothetical protein
MRCLVVLLLTGALTTALAADRVTYVPAPTLLTVEALSDGSLLIGGEADHLDWLPAGTPRVALPARGISPERPPPSKGQTPPPERIAFLLRTSADLGQVLGVWHLPKGVSAGFRRIRTESAPGEPTCGVHVSARAGSGYFIAKLDGDFLTRPPSAFAWVYNVAKTEGSHAEYQPWDVSADGKVTFAEGKPFSYDWSAIGRLRADGTDDVVEHWEVHTAADGEYFGRASSRPGALRSRIVLKSQGRPFLRSWTEEDYTASTPDGNGGTRRGRHPNDYYFKGPFNAADPKASPGGPGYTGYKIGTHPAQQIGAIAVDRRTGSLYFGFSTQSRLPDGNPDFEPCVVAMDRDGRLLWWNRLYEETSGNSTPDQYVDGLAVDYSQPAASGSLVVLARCHGNNVVNLWNGNKVRAPGNPGHAFRNGFTGTNGNIHIGWLGRFALSDGTLRHACYVAEWSEGAKLGNKPHPDPNLDGWPSPNDGWPDVNTTRCRPELKVDGQGRVALAATGRRTLTTRGAYQKMIKPAEGKSVWNDFIRVYSPDFTTLVYSSLLSGTWDPATGQGGGGNITGFALVEGAVVVVGRHEAGEDGALKGQPIPTANPPAWGLAKPTGAAGVAARLELK